MIKHLPNTLTCGNLFCGCLAVFHAVEGNFTSVAGLVFIALILDFLDGFVARLLRVQSAIGKELDSLADMVTFGVVPGIAMVQMLRGAGIPQPFAYFGLLLTVFSALRLAKFNTDTRQTTSFIGLPTPANAVFILSLPFIILQKDFQASIIGSSYMLIAITIVFSLLMVSEIAMFSLKFKRFSWSDNKIQFIFIGISITLLLIFRSNALSFIIITYIMLSIINNLYFNNIEINHGEVSGRN